MAKLILSLDGAFIGDFPIDKERMTVGRRATNDIHIDNLAVSGEHASILTIGNDSFLEDLDSTNGTLVNGKAIKKHVLQNGDVIEFGKFQLKYVSELAPGVANSGPPAEDFEKTMIIRPSAMKSVIPPPVTPQPTQPAVAVPSAVPAQSPAATPTPVQAAAIQVLTGSSAGKELILNKALTTLGKPGVQVAVITKRPQGYFITHVEGQSFPAVNGVSVGAQAHALQDHDVIELAGIKMEFYFTKT